MEEKKLPWQTYGTPEFWEMKEAVEAIASWEENKGGQEQ